MAYGVWCGELLLQKYRTIEECVKYIERAEIRNYTIAETEEHDDSSERSKKFKKALLERIESEYSRKF